MPGAKKGGEETEILVPLWDQIPDGSIIVIDEAWRIFPVRKQGAGVPDFVQFLATHRHRGFDIYLVTQQVKTQIDTFVRGLVGAHFHVERKSGLEYAKLLEWERLADPSSTKDVAAARESKWLYPTGTYGKYKSATMHTIKRNLPLKKIIVTSLTGVLAIGLVGFGIYRTMHQKEVEKATPALDSSGRASGQVVKSQFLGKDFWVADRVPRVAGNPASAPVYDPLQKVASQPRPEGCYSMAVGSSVRCECTGPNHSTLQVGLERCLDLVRKGWFDETRKYEDVKAQNIAFLNEHSNRMVDAIGAEQQAQRGEAVKPVEKKAAM